MELDKNHPLLEKKCMVCSSTHETRKSELDGQIYCGKHRTQRRRHGKILERTRFDNNRILEREGHCELYIYDKNGNFKAISLIDKEDIEKIKKYKWHQFNNKYIATDLPNKKILRLHRYVLGLKKLEDGEVDHINGDRTDNRKQNLRIVTRSQNLMNRKGVKGYYFDNYYQKWKAEIIVNGKKFNLGSFDTEEEAKQSRLEAERVHFGEFSSKIRKELTSESLKQQLDRVESKIDLLIKQEEPKENKSREMYEKLMS